MTQSDAVRMALALRRAHKWSRAIDILERALVEDPTDSLAWYWLAVTLDNRGEEARAVFAYHRAMYTGLDDPKLLRDAWAWLGNSLTKTGFPEDAMACFDRAEELGYPKRQLASFRERARGRRVRPRRKGLKRKIAEQVLAIPGVTERRSQFGPATAFWVDGREFLDVDSRPYLYVRLTKDAIRTWRATLRADERVRIVSDWAEVHVREPGDVADALDLVRLAAEANRTEPRMRAVKGGV